MTINKKYRLTDTTRPGLNGHPLYRIQALRDLGDKEVHAGDLGGWVQSEDNLSQEGQCWIYDDASVLDKACVSDDAIVQGHATVFGNAWVMDNAIVEELSRVYGHAIVENDAIVTGDAEVKDFARLGGDAFVDSAEISGYAFLDDNARILSPGDYITIGPIGGDYEYITCYKDGDGNIWELGARVDMMQDDFSEFAPARRLAMEVLQEND